MAIKASASITLTAVTDIASVTRYYLLQSSTLARPAKPTTKPPTGSWTDTEPTYTTGSTNSLYFVDLTVFSDGTWIYSSVSLSSSYEAAKAAYNKATSAQTTATVAQEIAIAKTTQFYQANEPESALTGDVWTKTDSDRVLRKDGSGTNMSSTQEAYSIPVGENVHSIQPIIIGGKTVVWNQMGELVSADVNAINAIGFNLLNPDEFEPNTRIYVSSGSALSYSGLTASGWIEAFPSTDYYFKMHSIGSSYAGTAFYDADKRYISGVAHTSAASYMVGILTTPPNCAYIRTCWANSDTDLCVNVSDADFNGQLTEFTPVQSFPIPAAVRTQYPLRSAGSTHDSYEYDDTTGKWSHVQRVETRAHQSGDDSDATVLTDGTTTHCTLAAPVITDITDLMPSINIVNTEPGGLIVFGQEETALPIPTMLLLSPWTDITNDVNMIALQARDEASAAQETAESAQSTADAARTEFKRVIRVNDEGLHVGDNQSSGEVLIDSNSVNVVFNGQRYSKFAANYVQFGNYQLRRSSDGGLVFKLS